MSAFDEQATEPLAYSPSGTDPFPTLPGERHFVADSEDPHIGSSDTEIRQSETPPGLEDSPWGLESDQTPPITNSEDRYRTVDTDRYATVSTEPAGDVPARSQPARIGAYEILSELGRGGMGVVYKARQVGLKRLVALKMILGAHAGAEQIARFRSEAEAVARMQHPNIVQIYEIGDCDGQPFFSLEFVEGGSLDRKLKGHPQPIAEAARQTEVLARAVHAAHQCGIVHRDLKPANVLLSADGVLKITDFGLAKQLDDDGSQTRSGSIVGTPSYMAPEQAEGKTEVIGPVSDVYALGAILYEMLTGRPPFRGSTVWETLDQVRGQEPVPPTRLQPKMPRDLETICLKCLQKERGKRYASAEALAEDLRRFQSNEPIEARPVSSWERLWKFARRKPVAAMLVGMSIVAVCVSAAAGFLLYANASQRADFYQQEAKKSHDRQLRSSLSSLRAQQLEGEKKWSEANAELQKADEALQGLPDVDELRTEVRRRLDRVQGKLEEQEKGTQAKGRVGRFNPLYHQALFYETMFTGLERQESRERARTAACTALAIYGLGANYVDSAGKPWDEVLRIPGVRSTSPLGVHMIGAGLDQDRPYLDKAEHQKLAGACYELLLIWADIEAGSASPLTPHASSLAEKGLALLARAARLGQAYGLDSRTYHVRKARYLAQSKGQKLIVAPRNAPKETGRLDWFLTALERYHRGLDHNRREDFVESIVACKQAIEIQKDDLWSHYVTALSRLRLGDWLDAKAELTICLSLKSDFAWPLLLRGFAASEYGSQQIGKDKKLAATEFKAARDDLDAALGQDQTTLVQYVGLANRGALSIRQMSWAQAVRDLERAVQLNNKGFQAYLSLAQALQGMKKKNESLAAMNKAVELAPTPLLYRSRAKLHLAYDMRKEARADYERAIALESPDSESTRLADNLFELGQLLQKNGDNRGALALYERGARIKPNMLRFQRFRAETLLALNRHRQAGEALDIYLAKTRPAPHDVYLARGVIYAEMGKLSDAIEMYTLALAQEPANAKTRCQRGWAYLLDDSVRPALEDFERCLKQDPGNVDALIGTGNARIRLRELDAALRLAWQAEKKPDQLTDRMFYNLARIYAQAAGQLEIETASARFPDRSATERLSECRKKALDNLRRATDRLTAQRRPAFWQTQIPSDPALSAIRGTREFVQLAARYGGL